MYDNPTYTIHRRVNAPLDFKGLKGRYILYGLLDLVGSLSLCAVLYFSGVSGWISLFLSVVTGGGGLATVIHFSRHYGVSGWQKRQVTRQMPKTLRIDSRTIFIHLQDKHLSL